MSTFEVLLTKVDKIEQIPNADSIEAAVIGEYRSVVQKGKFKQGDYVVYIPEQAVLPGPLIESLGLTGRLAGAGKNRVKAIKLRGVLSQGIAAPLDILPTQSDGTNTDYAELLGITKYDPDFALTEEARKLREAQTSYIGPQNVVRYDIENWKKHNRVFVEGVDDVYITEKLHGTMCCIAFNPHVEKLQEQDGIFVYSKGLGAKGFVFKPDENNVYSRAFQRLRNEFTSLFSGGNWEALYVFGEVYGQGVQDLGYNTSDPEFRAFDVWEGTPSQGQYWNCSEKFDILHAYGIPTVPILYTGKFNRESMLHLTSGKTTLGAHHTREGVVITSATEEYVPRFGRKILKNISEDYLLRKGNTTEFT
jgi:RNA ligase (TIGR02306 family)